LADINGTFSLDQSQFDNCLQVLGFQSYQATELLWRLIENDGFVSSATLYDALLILMFNIRKPQLHFYFTDLIRQMHG